MCVCVCVCARDCVCVCVPRPASCLSDMEITSASGHLIPSHPYMLWSYANTPAVRRLFHVKSVFTAAGDLMEACSQIPQSYCFYTYASHTRSN